MTPQQIAIVKQSWQLFQGINPVLVGDVFYSKVFLTDPSLKSMFHIPRDQQSRKIIEMLNVIVGRLDRLDELNEDIRQMAIRHKGYGVKNEHYQTIGNALLWTLEQGLGKDWNDSTENAWSECFRNISTAMMTASG
ncbi:MAG: hemoglobin [Gemmatimonadaceae bacterium]|nr:hemoglobin [Chitinophagaceae bacterium]